jgi:hypothetical protein
VQIDREVGGFLAGARELQRHHDDRPVRVLERGALRRCRQLDVPPRGEQPLDTRERGPQPSAVAHLQHDGQLVA